MRRIFCVKRRERRCCHRVYRVDRAPRGGPVFYYLRRGPFKARCLGTNGAVLKSGGLTDANKRSERKLVRVRGRARVRLYTRTTGPTAFYGFLTDHISRRPTTSRAPFVLSNKLANLHACTHATAPAERSSHRHPTGVSRINLPPLAAAAQRRLKFVEGGIVDQAAPRNCCSFFWPSVRGAAEFLKDVRSTFVTRDDARYIYSEGGLFSPVASRKESTDASSLDFSAEDSLSVTNQEYISNQLFIPLRPASQLIGDEQATPAPTECKILSKSLLP